VGHDDHASDRHETRSSIRREVIFAFRALSTQIAHASAALPMVTLTIFEHALARTNMPLVRSP
jgi:hypothetical protein